jgi:hypothetical protein
MSDDGLEDGGVWEDRALAAEAEIERLREALGKIKEYHRQGAAGECGEGPWDMAYEHVCWIAREALGEKP